MKKDRVRIAILVALASMMMGNSFSVGAYAGVAEEAIRQIVRVEGPLTYTKVFDKMGNSTSLYKYTFSVNTSNIVSGATGAVLGKTAYAELRTDAGDGTLVNSTNTTATNLKNLDTELAKMGNESLQSGSTDAITVTAGDPVTGDDGIAKTTYTVKANTDDIGDGLGTLVTGGTFYNEINLKEGNYSYISTANQTGKNLAALDTQIEKNRVQIFEKNKVDIEKLTNMTNITEAGEKVLNGLVKDGVQVAAGNESITVNHTEDTTGNRTYTISAQTGAVAKGSNQLVTGGTVYEELLVQDGEYNYIQPSDRAAVNLLTLDAQVKTNADNIIALDQRVGNRIEMLTGDLNQVGASAAALAALRPEPFDADDKWSFAVGYGHYRNRNAAAVGIYFKPTADTTISFGSTVWSGDPMLNVNTSFKLGSRGKAVKPMLDPELQGLVKRVKALEAEVAKQNKAMAGSVARADKMEANGAHQSGRMARLEEDNKLLQERHVAQVAMDAEKGQKMAKLKAGEKELHRGYVKLKEEIHTMDSQITAALAQLKTSSGK